MPSIILKEISLDDKPALTACAQLIRTHSWGADYPLDPLEELVKGECQLGAYAGNVLAGFAALNRWASPDGADNGALWLADVVVAPAFRRTKIFSTLLEKIMAQMRARPGPYFTCTDNPAVERYLRRQGWFLHRDTLDEAGGACRVYRLY